MRPFQLIEPDSIEAAVAALVEHPDARPIAGGTALLVLIKHGVYLPETLVNLRKLTSVAAIAPGRDGGLRIGALASVSEVERHPQVRERYPVLAEACHVVANSRIRNLATIGGNVAHADYQSDPPGVLVALGAEIEITGPDAVRLVPMADFVIGAYETVLEPGELVSAILIPPLESAWRGTYLKFTTRSSEDRPAVGVTALLRVDGGRCVDARIVVGAVTPVPARIAAAEAALQDLPVDGGSVPALAAAVADALDPIDDLRGSAAYKRRVAGVIVERAVANCLTQGKVA